jgi:HAD superfamily hydrolase (TIGR01490 family)
MSRRIAFFDVDETLIAAKSMFALLAFDLQERGRPPTEYDRIERSLRAMAARGTPREEVCRAYYRLLAGRDAAELAASGERWFAIERRRGELFNLGALRAARRHTAAGDLVVLLSGSFPACVDPVARSVGADVVLCTRPEVRDGRHTGRVGVPMIGAAKAQAARRLAARRGADLAHAHAYGDHVSDLALLELVGHPVVVGADPVLARLARRRGWQRLPGAPRAHTTIPLMDTA